MHAEVGAGNNGQSSEASDHQLAHIQTGNVLDYHAAGFDQLAFESGEGHANHEVARSSVAAAHGTAHVGCEHAAYGCAGSERGVERDHLAALRKEMLHF